MSDGVGLLFDRVADEYDRVRREYPTELVDAACEAGGLVAGSRVVEIGCGTGKLTGALAARDLRIDAVDPGGELVAIARRRVGTAPVRFHVGRFEDVELPRGDSDAVFSATAFHWVDPAVGWSKAAALLRTEGVLALLTHIGARNARDAAFLDAWREVLPEAVGWASREPDAVWEGAEERRANVSEVWAWLEQRDLGRPEAAELFGDVQIASVPIAIEETIADFLAHIRTTSSYLRLDAARRARIEERFTAILEPEGSVYRANAFAVLVTARARPSA